MFGDFLVRIPECELTEIHMDAVGDTTIDPFSTADWVEISRTRHLAAPGESADYSFVTLVQN